MTTKSNWANWRGRNPEKAKELAARYTREYKARYPWATCLSSVRQAAKARGAICTIDADWARRAWTGRCAVTGLPFVKSRRPSPFSPSIDRIRPKEGYTPENSRFVLLGYNMLKGSGSDKDAARIASAILNHKEIACHKP